MDLLSERCVKVSCILLALSFAPNSNEYEYPRRHILKFADDSVIVPFLNIGSMIGLLAMVFDRTLTFETFEVDAVFKKIIS